MSRWARVFCMVGLALGLTVSPAVAQDEPEETAAPLRTLRIWFPDALGSAEGSDVALLLAGFIGEFQTANSDVQVDFRLKRAGDASTPGTLMHNLRTARAVAPGTLPHLTLLRRSELTIAVRDGLVGALTPDAEAALLVGLRPAVAVLGQIGGVTYGVPFTLEVQHQVHQPALALPSSWALDDVLADEWRFVLPAGQSTLANDVLIAQVAEAGGFDENGQLRPDLTALTAIYQFYADALAANVIPAEALRFEAARDYLPLLESGELYAGVVSSSDYLRLAAQDTALIPAPLPTLGGEPASLLDGWVWVLPTGSAEERALALRFIDWMDEPARQAEYASAIRQIPARTDAFTQWAEGDYGALLAALFAGGALPPRDITTQQPELARALQNGLVQVLNGTVTPAEAAETALDSLE